MNCKAQKVDKTVVVLDYVKDYLVNVKKLKTQLTQRQAETLLEKYTVSQIQKQLNNMENYKPLAQKYTSVYLTLVKWFEIDERRGFGAVISDQVSVVSLPPTTDHKPPTTDAEIKKKMFFKKHPVGSIYISKSGGRFIVENDVVTTEDGLSSIPLSHLI